MPAALTIAQVHGAWEAAWNNGRRQRHPLAPLVEAWQKRPEEVHPKDVQANSKRVDLILPKSLSNGPSRDSRVQKGKLLDHVEAINCASQHGHQLLPTLALPSELPVCMSMALLRAVTGAGNGNCTPMALRWYIKSLLYLPQECRQVGGLYAYSLTERQLRTMLYGGERAPRPHEWHKAAYQSAWIIGLILVPMLNPSTGSVGLYRPVSVNNIDLETHNRSGGLDDPRFGATMTFRLPPGCHDGPQVDMEDLNYWERRSFPRWQLLVNSAYLLHHPGKTKIPVKKRRGKGMTWVWSSKLSAFPVVTPSELAMQTFGAAYDPDNKKQVSRARKHLEGLAEMGHIAFETTSHGDLILLDKDFHERKRRKESNATAV